MEGALWVLVDLLVGKGLFKGCEIWEEEFANVVFVSRKWEAGKSTKIEEEFSWTTTSKWSEVEISGEDLWKGNMFSWEITFLETTIFKVSRIMTL